MAYIITVYGWLIKEMMEIDNKTCYHCVVASEGNKVAGIGMEIFSIPFPLGIRQCVTNIIPVRLPDLNSIA